MSAIDDKYAELGGASGFLGSPVEPEKPALNGGRFRLYEGGSIYWHPDTRAWEVHGAIRDKWAELGWEHGFLGYPLTDEYTPPDSRDHNREHTRGRFNHFQGGSIYWTPQTGAHVVRGAIRDFWENQGWEQGELGYPMSDELVSPDGGRYSVFEGGVVYWKQGEGTRIADFEDLSPNFIIQLIDQGLSRIIQERNAPLDFEDPTEFIKTHHWYKYGEQFYYRVMELDLDLKADISGPNPDVDIDLFLTFDLEGENIVVKLIREKHEVDSHWLWEIVTIGIAEIIDQIADRRLGDALRQAIGQSEGFNLQRPMFAVQLQDNGSLRIFTPPTPPIRL